MVKEFVVAGFGRVFQGVVYPSRRDACRARHWEYVRALADGLNFTQAARAVGVSKRTGKDGVMVVLVLVGGVSVPALLRRRIGTVCI